jgi:hypothetical protein
MNLEANRSSSFGDQSLLAACEIQVKGGKEWGFEVGAKRSVVVRGLPNKRHIPRVG